MNNTAKKKVREADVKANKSKLTCDKLLADEEHASYNQSLITSKAEYENKLVNKLNDNPKLFFNYVRNFYRTSSTIEILETDQGEKVFEDSAKANMLNNFFSSVQTNEESFLGDIPIADNPVDNSIRFQYIQIKDVINKINRLQLNKACGPDGIHVNVLKKATSFAKPLQMIFNQSVYTNSIPQDWRDSNINPIHKKGSRKNCNNYRPVALTSQVVKLLERILYDQINNHLKRHNVISCEQHGFQSGCSCTTQLLECLNDWTSMWDLGLQTDIVYLDFSKAFDSVPFKRLQYKLKYYGVAGHIGDWIEHFLSGRRQRVLLRNGTSCWNTVLSGVPQGSILGPILFLLYVNELPKIVHNTAKMFADDTKIYSSIIDELDCDKLQDDLNSLSAWSAQWLLKFNESKCIVLKLKESIQYIYSLNGINLETVNQQRDLGVIISTNLKPETHINDIVKRASQRIGLIKRCFTNLTQKKVATLYTTTIRPILEYASVIWQPFYNKDIVKLQKVQDRCLSLCDVPIELESLKLRRDKTDLVETYKILHHKYKLNPDSLFIRPNRDLRGHEFKLHRETVNTDIRKNFFTNRVIDKWNNLPAETVAAPREETFKKKLRVTPSDEVTY